jgi:hypothetical protein
VADKVDNLAYPPNVRKPMPGIVFPVARPREKHHSDESINGHTPGGFTSVLGTQLSRVRLGIEACEFGLSVLGADRAQQRGRVGDFRDFCEFCTQAYRDESLRMWTDYRAKRRQR